MELQGKTIAITGAAQGLGQSMAQVLANKGAHLALLDISEDKLDETLELCREAGAQARPYAVNVAEEESVAQAFQSLHSDFGRLDGLINNAGTNQDALLAKPKDGDVQAMSLEAFNKVIAVDLTGVFLCGREAAALMLREGNGGVIINVSSIARVGNKGQSNYAAAKAGVASMTVTWAQELARHGIRVAGIAPGFSNTQMVAGMKPEILEKIRAAIPLGRLGQPQEIGHSVLYLLENDYFAGRVLEVDGGLRL